MAELFDQPSVVNNAVMRCQLGKLLQDMTGNDHGDALLLIDAVNNIPYLDNALRVKAVDRLIQNQQLRLANGRHCDAKALLHAE